MQPQSTWIVVLLATLLLALPLSAATAQAGKNTSPFAGRYTDVGGFAYSPEYGEIRIGSNGRISGKTSFTTYWEFTQTTRKTYRGKVTSAGVITLEVEVTANTQNSTTYT